MTVPNQEKAAEIVALRNRMYAVRDKLDLTRSAIKRTERRRDILAAQFRNTALADRHIAVLKAREVEIHNALDKAVALLCKAEQTSAPASTGKHGRDIYRLNKWEQERSRLEL